jgi:hypothetical protein
LKQPKHIGRRGGSKSAGSSNPTRHPLSAKIKNKKGGLELAQHNVETLFILGVYELLALAFDKKNRASKRAVELLAFVDTVITQNREKLCEANEAYRREKTQLGKIFRIDVWQPESPFYQAIHRELWHCWFYRKENPAPLFQGEWGEEEYQLFMKLPEFSLRSLALWEKLLWPLFKKHNPQLRAELQRRYKRVETRWSKYRKEFHQHLHTLAKATGRGNSVT